PLNGKLPSWIVRIAKVPDSAALLAFTPESVSCWDFARPRRYIGAAGHFPPPDTTRLPSTNVANQLSALADWYAFRGVDDWAADCFERAREMGAPISSLQLARCYWKVGRREDAEREFRLAITGKEAPADYLSACLRAVAGEL